MHMNVCECIYHDCSSHRHRWMDMDVGTGGHRRYEPLPHLFANFVYKVPFSTYIMASSQVRLPLNPCAPHFLNASYVPVDG